MKTVFITGANRGLGFETAKQLAQLGYFIYIGCLNIKDGQDAVNKLKEMGLPNADAIEINNNDIESVKKAKTELASKTKVLDVLINNAGVAFLDRPQNPSEIELSTIKEIFETNFFGNIRVTQQFLELLKKSDEPRIVNVASELGSLTMQADPTSYLYDFKPTGYMSSKAAINALTIAFSHELVKLNFKVNSIDPGMVATDLNGHMEGGIPIEQAVKIIVKCATLDNDGPTGKFFNTKGELLPW